MSGSEPEKQGKDKQEGKKEKGRAERESKALRRFNRECGCAAFHNISREAKNEGGVNSKILLV